MSNIVGLRTIIGIILCGLVGTVYGIDINLHDLPATPELETSWLPAAVYDAILSTLGTVTGVTMMLKWNKTNALLEAAKAAVEKKP